MKTAMRVAQLLSPATLLLVTLGAFPASAQTFEAAVEAFERGDYATALDGLRIYAEQDDAIAQFNLGLMYARGEGLPEDAAAAVQWYRLAAEQGYARAQFNLGSMYARGEGIPEDDAEAVRWLRPAAEQGVTLAQALLGGMYAQGEGVPKDTVDAYAWLNIAAAQGITTAKEFKELFTRLMTQSQIAEAQKRSREYWTRYVVPFQ